MLITRLLFDIVGFIFLNLDTSGSFKRLLLTNLKVLVSLNSSSLWKCSIFYSISQKSGDSVVDCGENNYLSAKAQEEAQILYKAGK